MGYHEIVATDTLGFSTEVRDSYLQFLQEFPHATLNELLDSQFYIVYQSFVRRVVEALQTELYEQTPDEVLLYIFSSEVEQDLLKHAVVGMQVSAYIPDLTVPELAVEKIVNYSVRSVSFNFEENAWEVHLRHEK